MYNGIHSITFIESDQLLRDGDTLTTIISVRNTWNSFHLVPLSRPFISVEEATVTLVSDTVSNKVFDLTDELAGGRIFKSRKGQWEFLVDHDKWDSWYEAKNNIEKYINGKRLYCMLQGDNKIYHGRFKVSSWEDGNSYSKVSIEYDLDHGTYYITMDVNRPINLSVSWKSQQPTIYVHQKKEIISKNLNVSVLYQSGYSVLVKDFIIEGTFNSSGIQNVIIKYFTSDVSTSDIIVLTSNISVDVSNDVLRSIKVHLNNDTIIQYGDEKDKIRQNSTIIRSFVSGFHDSIDGINATPLSGNIEDWGKLRIPITYNNESTYVDIVVKPEKSWRCLKYAINNGLYKYWFNIGDKLELKLTKIYQPQNQSVDIYDGYTQIVAFDRDVDSNGNTIPVTFINVDCLIVKKPMKELNSSISNFNGYGSSTLKVYIDDLYNTFPEDIRSMIKYSSKQTKEVNGTSDLSLRIWIPSIREIRSYTEDEQIGASYIDNIERYIGNREFLFEKKFNNIASNFATRSCVKIGNNYYYYWVGPGSTDIAGTASLGIENGLVLGFCVGALS